MKAMMCGFAISIMLFLKSASAVTLMFQKRVMNFGCY